MDHAVDITVGRGIGLVGGLPVGAAIRCLDHIAAAGGNHAGLGSGESDSARIIGDDAGGNLKALPVDPAIPAAENVGSDIFHVGGGSPEIVSQRNAHQAVGVIGIGGLEIIDGQDFCPGSPLVLGADKVHVSIRLHIAKNNRGRLIHQTESIEPAWRDRADGVGVNLAPGRTAICSTVDLAVGLDGDGGIRVKSRHLRRPLRKWSGVVGECPAAVDRPENIGLLGGRVGADKPDRLAVIENAAGLEQKTGARRGAIDLDLFGHDQAVERRRRADIIQHHDRLGAQIRENTGIGARGVEHFQLRIAVNVGEVDIGPDATFGIETVDDGEGVIGRVGDRAALVGEVEDASVGGRGT